MAEPNFRPAFFKSYVSVGIDKELTAETSDEYDTITPESRSLKYYLPYEVYVYDRITVGYEDSVTLKKADQHGNPVAGAKYQLYKYGTLVSPTVYTTDEKGLLVITEVLSSLGNFSLKEIEAPSGYELDSTPLNFTIEDATNNVTLGGGLNKITPTGGQEITAGNNEVFIAGPTDATYSPDIALTSTDSDVKVHVLYSSLVTGFDDKGVITEQKPVTRDFDSLQDAQNDINNEKNDNHIAGSVQVNVSTKGKNSVELTHINKKTPPPPPLPETVAAAVSKVWDDNNNEDSVRPDEIKVTLYKDDVPTANIAVLNENNGWKHTFYGLTKYRPNGTAYTYTVKETKVPEGYSAAVSSSTVGNMISFTITNTRLDPEPPPVTPPVTPPPSEPPVTPPPTTPPTTPPSNPNIPQTSDDAPIAAYIILTVLFGAAAIVCWVKRKPSARYEK